MPPPPAEAFSITGYPIRPAAASASLVSARAPVPGAVGTRTASASARAATLSPMRSMASGDGPTQTSPASRTLRAKPAFSLRNP